MPRHPRRIVPALLLLAFVAKPAAAASTDDLSRLSLEDLLSLEATSVAKKRQRVMDAAAAVFVITQEDIRRSGARTVPDLLRMVPGVEVGAIDGNSTAVSMRGFNTRFANSVLVLVNGRAIYVSAISGVLWDQLLDPLDTIERIEVVRGPGATIWGANAVNGIINIITKDAAHALGGSAQARLGTDGRDLSLRYGASGGTVGYQLSAAGRWTNGIARLSDGATTGVATRGAQLGGQIDYVPDDVNGFSIRATGSTGDFGPRSTAGKGHVTQGGYREGNMLGRWSHRVGDRADLTAQSYLNHVTRRESGVWVSETQVDVETHGSRTFARDEIGAGLNYRLTASRLGSDLGPLGFAKDGLRDELVSAFVQNDHWLRPDRLRFTAGTKVEHSSQTGWSLQPSARLLWRPSQSTSFWAAASRAVRTPSLLERYATFSAQAGPVGRDFYSPVPVTIKAFGTARLPLGLLDAFEVGARFPLGDQISLDLAAYHNRYRNLVGIVPVDIRLATVLPQPSIAAEYRILANSRAETNGVELTLTATPTAAFRIDGYLSLVHSTYSIERSVPADVPGLGMGAIALPLFPQPGLLTTPANQGGVRARWDVGRDIELDGWLRHVGALRQVRVAAYTTLDLRLAWRTSDVVSIALIGQNLLDRRRLQFRESLISAAPTLVTRRAAIDLRARF